MRKDERNFWDEIWSEKGALLLGILVFTGFALIEEAVRLAQVALAIALGVTSFFAYKIS